MSLIKFFQAIDNSLIGKIIDKKLKIVEHTDPDRIYIENIRSFYNIPFKAAQFFCEMAVKENYFKKKIGVRCPQCDKLLLTVDHHSEIPSVIKCDNCELLEEEVFEFDFKAEYTDVFYQLNQE
jgi:phage FluMu protein Com